MCYKVPTTNNVQYISNMIYIYIYIYMLIYIYIIYVVLYLCVILCKKRNLEMTAQTSTGPGNNRRMVQVPLAVEAVLLVLYFAPSNNSQ